MTKAHYTPQAYFIPANGQRPKPAWEYNPEAVRHAADLARKARRRAMWWRLAVFVAYVALAVVAMVAVARIEF